MAVMRIGGTAVAAPLFGGLTVKREKIWKQDAGRSESGLYNGTVATIKTTYSIKWPPLTVQQAAAIEAAVSNVDKGITTLELEDMTGTVRTLSGYFGTPTYTLQWWGGSGRPVRDCSVDFIER